MEKVFEIASSVSTPLGLGGFFAASVFFIFKQIISKDFVRQMTSVHSVEVITLIVERLFILALVAMILGFVAYIVTKMGPQDLVRDQNPIMLKPPLPKPAIAPEAAPVATPITCRHPANGLEKWGQEQTITFDSGWRNGGSSPGEYCATKVQERRQQYADREVTIVGTPGEQSKEEFFRQFYYRYTCIVRERWEPIYKLAPNEECT